MTDHTRKLRELATASGRTIADVTEYWSERAAILEYDAHLTREQAEAEALVQVQAWLMRGAAG